MPTAGFTRFRKNQIGYQGSNTSAHLTSAATAVRVLPYRGVPQVERNATFADIDVGSLHKVQSPYYMRGDFTQSMDGPLTFNDWPWLASAALVGVSAPTGATAKTWTHQPASTTADPLGLFTVQMGDDVTTDWFQMVGGVLESLELNGPDDMGPVTVSANWRYADANSTGATDYPVSGTVPTTGLTVDDEPTFVYLADAELFINDSAATIGTTKISDALHSFNLSITNNLDLKSYANGSNTRFQLHGYGRGEQEISLSLQFAKTSQTVGTTSEADDWFSDTPVKRFMELRFTSPAIITGTTPYSLSLRLAGWYVTREDGEIGGNTTVTLTMTGAYDSDLGYALRAVAVNTLAGFS